jgi:hypothetical protein
MLMIPSGSTIARLLARRDTGPGTGHALAKKINDAAHGPGPDHTTRSPAGRAWPAGEPVVWSALADTTPPASAAPAGPGTAAHGSREPRVRPPAPRSQQTYPSARYQRTASHRGKTQEPITEPPSPSSTRS